MLTSTTFKGDPRQTVTELPELSPNGHMFRFQEKSKPKPSWSRPKYLIIAATAAVVLLLAVVVPASYCVSGSGRCGRKSDSSSKDSSSSSSSSSSKTTAVTSISYPKATASPLVANANPILVQGFEWYMPKDGKHWSRLTAVLPQMHKIGISNLWIPPPTKAATAQSIGYDVYDLWDLGEFNVHNRTATAFGTKSDLLNLTMAAHEIGIGITVDASLNQRSGADSLLKCTVTRLNPSNRLQATSPSKVIEVWANFTFASRKGLYSNKTWGCDDFTAVDYDATNNESGLFKINGNDNDFETDVGTENGNFDYLELTDVAYENPAVRKDVEAWGRWITSLLGVSGFRIDAAKHISQGFVAEWISSVTSVQSDKKMLFAAEYWTSDVSQLMGYLDGVKEESSVFDVPLLNTFHSIGNVSNSDITALFANNTVVALSPSQAVTFVANHDTQPGQATDNLAVSEWFKPFAYAFTLLRSGGYPCIFYGDLVGTYNQAGTFTKPSYSRDIATLAVARTYFAYGDQHDYSNAASNVLGWTRTGSSSYSNGNGLAVTMCNAAASATLSMFVGTQHSGETWTDVMGHATSNVKIGSDGFGSFPAPATNVSVFINSDAWTKTSFDASTWSLNPYTF